MLQTNLIKIVSFLVLYRSRKSSDGRTGDSIQLENDWSKTYSNLEFDNPGFVEEPIYESISSATGSSIQSTLREANTGLQELRFQADTRNAVTSKTQEEERNIRVDFVKRTAVFNPTYDQPYPGGSIVEGYGYQNVPLNKQGESCNTVQGIISQRLRETENGKDHLVQDDDDCMKPEDDQHNTPTDGCYENVPFKNESMA